jgi:hypothetical protein
MLPTLTLAQAIDTLSSWIDYEAHSGRLDDETLAALEMALDLMHEAVAIAAQRDTERT